MEDVRTHAGAAPRHGTALNDRRKMKATWITSSLGGGVLVVVIHVFERNGDKASMPIVLPLFLAVAFVGIIGIGQIREMYAERKRRSLGFFGIMAEREDFTRFYFPAWGRMFAWFAAVVVTSLSLKAWLP